ncbi:hypothetical protein GO755_25560 [Spirosoma sp. HMF4905]|uniref:Uncharacterized protein n=1 Tax=Spirosoma arboris TaxID=2682092 RepID=A0A7K1SHY8_9BACT|nr:hypothetical protein [Spirosoma arboris]MVM33430.1 hypothetical protein [Spirosoma arboris]
MTAVRKNDILFDDFSILTKLIGPKELIAPSINTNCDCSAYYSTEDDEAIDPRQITASVAAAN